MRYAIRSRYVELVFDGIKGTVSSLRNLETGDDCIKHEVEHSLFTLEAMEAFPYDSKKSVIPGRPSTVTVLAEKDGQRMVMDYQDSADGSVRFKARVEVFLAEDSCECVWGMTLHNLDERCRFVEVLFPCIRGIELGSSWEDEVLLYPHHAGEKTANPVAAYASEKYAGFWRAGTIRETYGYSREINYCGLASMTWMYLQDRENGLYWGSHDPRFPLTGLRVETGCPDRPWMGFGFRKYTVVGPGQSWSDPEYVVALTGSSWHWGAKRYRNWIDRHIDPPESPGYLKDQYILNQCYNFKRNNGIANRFTDIPAMFEEGMKELGMDHMFMASWNRSGFDTDYPEFQPDMELGTPWELYEGCKYIKERGGLATFYINARIFNVDSDYHPSLGNRWAIRDHQGASMNEEYGPLEFTVNCPSHREWKQYLLDMSRWMVQSYGAAGIYLDQLGSADPYPCYQPEHSHGDIGEFNTGYLELLRELLPELRRMNPDSFLMIENCGDIYGSYVWGSLTWNGTDYDEYYEMFKYTFPEYVQVNMVNPRRGLPAQEQMAVMRRDMARAMLLGSVLWIGMDKFGQLEAEDQRFVRDSVGMRKRLQPLIRDGVFTDVRGIQEVSPQLQVRSWQLEDGGSLYMVANLEGREDGYFQVDAGGREAAEVQTEDLNGVCSLYRIEAEGNRFCIAAPQTELSSVVLRAAGTEDGA